MKPREGKRDGQDESPQSDEDGQELFVRHAVTSLSLPRSWPADCREKAGGDSSRHRAAYPCVDE